MTQDEIKTLIPHRPPFLWLDEVTRITAESVEARTYLSPNLELFRGHYPSFGVVPGVILCEMAFQAAAVLIATILPEDEGRVPVVARLSSAKFKRMVRPDETALIMVTLTETLRNAHFFKGTVRVENETAVQLEFAAVMATPTP